LTELKTAAHQSLNARQHARLNRQNVEAFLAIKAFVPGEAIKQHVGAHAGGESEASEEKNLHPEFQAGCLGHDHFHFCALNESIRFTTETRRARRQKLEILTPCSPW